MADKRIAFAEALNASGPDLSGRTADGRAIVVVVGAELLNVCGI